MSSEPAGRVPPPRGVFPPDGLIDAGKSLDNPLHGRSPSVPATFSGSTNPDPLQRRPPVRLGLTAWTFVPTVTAVVGLWVGYWVGLVPWWAHWLLATPLYCYILICGHDAVHNTAHRNSWVNSAVGWVSLLVLGIPLHCHPTRAPQSPRPCRQARRLRAVRVRAGMGPPHPLGVRQPVLLRDPPEVHAGRACAGRDDARRHRRSSAGMAGTRLFRMAASRPNDLADLHGPDGVLAARRLRQLGQPERAGRDGVSRSSPPHTGIPMASDQSADGPSSGPTWSRESG